MALEGKEGVISKKKKGRKAWFSFWFGVCWSEKRIEETCSFCLVGTGVVRKKRKKCLLVKEKKSLVSLREGDSGKTRGREVGFVFFLKRHSAESQ